MESTEKVDEALAKVGAILHDLETWKKRDLPMLIGYLGQLRMLVEMEGGAK
jgi:hypothetical protein